MLKQDGLLLLNGFLFTQKEKKYTNMKMQLYSQAILLFSLFKS